MHEKGSAGGEGGEVEDDEQYSSRDFKKNFDRVSFCFGVLF